MTAGRADAAGIGVGPHPEPSHDLERTMPETTNPQADVEERVARHLAAKDWGDGGVPWASDPNGASCSHYLAAAREVIALVQAAPAGRAAEWSAAADVVAEMRDTTDVNVAEYHRYDFRQRIALSDAESRLRRRATELRRMADEAPQPETQPAADCPYGEGPGDGSGCIKPAGHAGDHVVTSGVEVVPCSRAVLHQPHIPHVWWPQPGMVYVQCPGHSLDPAAVSQPGKEARS
jgi:hypothetical protein